MKAWCCGENWTTRRLSRGRSVTWPMCSNRRATVNGRAPCIVNVLRFFAGWGTGPGSLGRLTPKEMLRAIGVTQPGRNHFTKRAWQFFGSLATAGELPARWLIWEAWQENSAIIRERMQCTEKA